MSKLKFFIIYLFIIGCLTFTNFQISPIDISKLNIINDKYLNPIIQYDVTDYILYNQQLEIPTFKHFKINNTIQLEKDIEILSSKDQIDQQINDRVNILNQAQKIEQYKIINDESTLRQKIRFQPEHNINKNGQYQKMAKINQQIGLNNEAKELSKKKNTEIKKRQSRSEAFNHQKNIGQQQQNLTNILFYDQKQPKLSQDYGTIKNFSDIAEINYVNQILNIKSIEISKPQINQYQIPVSNSFQNFPEIIPYYSITNQFLKIKQEDKFIIRNYQQNQNESIKIQIIKSQNSNLQQQKNSQIAIKTSVQRVNEIQNKSFTDQILQLKQFNKFIKKQIQKQQIKIPQINSDIRQKNKNQQIDILNYFYSPKDINQDDYTSSILNLPSQNKFSIKLNIPTLPQFQSVQKLNQIKNQTEKHQVNPIQNLQGSLQTKIGQISQEELAIKDTYFGDIKIINQNDYTKIILNLPEINQVVKNELSKLQYLQFKDRKNQLPILYKVIDSPIDIIDLDYTSLILNDASYNQELQIQKINSDSIKKQQQQIKKKIQQSEKQKSEENQQMRRINYLDNNDYYELKQLVLVFFFIIFIFSAGIFVAIKVSVRNLKQRPISEDEQQNFQQQLQQFYQDDDYVLEVRQVKPVIKRKSQDLLSSHDNFMQIMQSQQL